jgi:hypothetical protein
MTKNIYEIFDEFQKQKNETDRRKVLLKYHTPMLVTFLQLAFDPRIKFTVKEIPKYKPQGHLPGMGYSTMGPALKKAYLFIEGHPRRPNLTPKKQDVLLIQLLEGLEDREAVAYSLMLQKKVDIPYLTPKLIEKTFQGIFDIKVNV